MPALSFYASMRECSMYGVFAIGKVCITQHSLSIFGRSGKI